MNTRVLCGRTSDAVPLLSFEYGGRTLHICSQHLPVLIHDRGQLGSVLPGAETLRPSFSGDQIAAINVIAEPERLRDLHIAMID